VSPSSQEPFAFGWEIHSIEKLYRGGTLINWTIEKSGGLV
jgi:hypothetical protein